MTQFGGSLRFVQLPAVAQLLAELRCTGRLRMRRDDWTGEIVLREGQIVGASLGAERGRAALEAIALALPDGDFDFVDGPVNEDGLTLVAEPERAAYLDRLNAERQRLSAAIPSLSMIPILAIGPSIDSDTAGAARSYPGNPRSDPRAGSYDTGAARSDVSSRSDVSGRSDTASPSDAAGRSDVASRSDAGPGRSGTLVGWSDAGVGRSGTLIGWSERQI